MSDLAFADDIVILSSSYSEMQGLLEAVNRRASGEECLNALHKIEETFALRHKMLE